MHEINRDKVLNKHVIKKKKKFTTLLTFINILIKYLFMGLVNECP
jgi:hypothetical protein